MTHVFKKLEIQYTTIFDHLRLGIYRTNHVHKIITANSAFIKLVGYTSQSEVINKTLEELGITFANNRAAHLSSSADIEGYESFWIRKDGVKIFIRESLVRIDDNGKCNYVGTIEIIHTLNSQDPLKIGKQFTPEIPNKESHEDKVKDAFLGTLNHEIRSPLNGIIGLTELLLASSLPNAVRQQIEIIRISEEQLLYVTNDILDYFEIQAGRLELEETNFNICTLIENVLKLFSFQARNNEIIITHSIDPSVPRWLISDAGKIQQILTNFLKNSLRTTQKGEISIGVSLTEFNYNRMLLLSLTDTGIGFTPEIQGNLLKTFSESNHSSFKKFENGGLGLLLTTHLIELMGGTVKISHPPPNGNKYEFTVPFLTGKEVFPANLSSTSTFKKRDKKFRILVVEDNFINQQVALKILNKLGYVVDIVNNGLEALEKIQQSLYDLILMDCQMPIMDGYTASSEIRRLEKENGEKPIPIIALTAHALKVDREKCFAAGMNDYITKPINIKLLASTLELWILGQKIT